MGRMPLLACLWPGLPWILGSGVWPGLFVAVGFALLANLALVTSFVWYELTTAELRIAIWVAVAVLWSISAICGYRSIRRRAAASQVDRDDEFGRAQDYYLAGDWFQTQRILGTLLRRDPRDLEARLMLATMLRHTDQPKEARGQLDQIGLLEDSGRWELELKSERRLLAAGEKNRD